MKALRALALSGLFLVTFSFAGAAAADEAPKLNAGGPNGWITATRPVARVTNPIEVGGVSKAQLQPRAPRAARSATSPPTSGGSPVLCEGNNYANDNYRDNELMGGPLIGIAWTPDNSVTITRIEVFTGEVEAPNALSIWSDDGGAPAQPLASLGFTAPFQTVLPNSWQGADLLTPVSVTAGTPYWVVWDPSGGEQASDTEDPADLQQTYWGSYDGTVAGGAIWFGPFSFPENRWKFRMSCAP